jgi:hypothetical protein
MKYIMLDGGDFTNRDANGIPMMDGTKFPHGFPWLANFVLTNGFKLGVYGVAAPNVGLSGDIYGDYTFYGAEAAGANYFLTNGVTYYKFDAPIGTLTNGVSVWPNEGDYYGNVVSPFGINDTYDLSYLEFATLCRRASQPVFFNGATTPFGGHYSPNITTLLNYWRFSGTSTTNSMGQTIGGDIQGAHQELLLWNWINLAASQLPPQSGWNFPDFDVLNSYTMPAFERHMYACAEFGSAFQTAYPTYDTGTFWYHANTNELGNQLLRQIRARGTTPHFAYATNGCYIYTKDNLKGGKDVLVENENYNIYAGAGSGSDEGLYGRWDALVMTNSYTYNSSPYYYVFYATNAVLDPGLLGLTGTNVLITTISSSSQSTIQSSGPLSVFVKAAGANLYTINPVNSFPTYPATVSLNGLPYFNFWSTNQAGNPYTEIEPEIYYLTVNGTASYCTTLGGAAYYGINGASSFQCTAGCDGGAFFAPNSYQNFYVDGSLVATTMVWTAAGQYTNIFIPFAPTNQLLEIQSCQTVATGVGQGVLANAQFNYTNTGNYVGAFNGNAGGLTNLQASNLVGWPATNAMLGGGIINAALRSQVCFTNASFAFAQPINVNPAQVPQPVVGVTNSSGSLISITPNPSWHIVPNSIWNCTNWTMVTLWITPWITNAACTPIF